MKLKSWTPCSVALIHRMFLKTTRTVYSYSIFSFSFFFFNFVCAIWVYYEPPIGFLSSSVWLLTNLKGYYFIGNRITIHDSSMCLMLKSFKCSYNLTSSKRLWWHEKAEYSMTRLVIFVVGFLAIWLWNGRFRYTKLKKKILLVV